MNKMRVYNIYSLQTYMKNLKIQNLFTEKFFHGRDFEFFCEKRLKFALIVLPLPPRYITFKRNL